jgi:hypothetical protein
MKIKSQGHSPTATNVANFKNLFFADFSTKSCRGGGSGKIIH